MGKSPAKWLRSVLLGKKGAKSGISKKSANNKGPLVSSKEPSNLSGEPCVPEPLPVSTRQLEEHSYSEKGEAAKSHSDAVVSTSIKHNNNNADSASATTLTLPEDSQKLRLEQAATKAQAAFRGYLARRECQTLKGIIKLQAGIRGHLVRRQAVATLYCLLGIVKIQALVRGQIVRRSNVKREVLRKQALGYSKTNPSIPAEELLKNAFTEKLLSLSPSSMHLHLQYGPGKPNSAHEWLMRWTLSKVWIPESQPKDISDSNHQRIKTYQETQNQTGRMIHSVKIENGSNHLSLEDEKVKSNPKICVSEHEGNEIEKVRLNLNKISKPIMENLRKPTITLAHELSGKSDNTPCCEPEKPADVETLHEGLPIVAALNELSSVPADLKAIESQFNEPTKPDDAEALPEKLLVKELSSKIAPESIVDKNEDVTTSNEVLNCNHKENENENGKNSQRRASLPIKYDIDSGTRTARKLPSYMAQTQSARAKVREQASPRYGQEGLDNNAVKRRYSMPSLTTGKLSSSPRVQKLVQASGKEGIKIDRSLSTSRDASDNAIRAGWKR